MKTTIKTSLLLVFGFFLFTVAGAQTAKKISVKKSTLKIDKVTLKEWNLDLYYKALGTPERTRDGYNKTHTYDAQGVVVFEPMKDDAPSGKVSEFQIYFSLPAEKNQVMPNNTYKNSLKVDKLNVTATLTPAEMKKKLSKWKTTDAYIEHSYRMELNGMYIYFQFNTEETGLEKVSIGLVKKK